MRVHTIDLRFQGLPGVIAAYLVEGPAGAVLVETGPGSTLPALWAGLAERGLRPADVRHVFVTHIHLDHAGAAGWWARDGAMVYVHRVGAAHLVDPSRLLASAQRIYADRMEALWGDVLPAPQERVTALDDGDVLELAGLRFAAIDTPGHARHHMVYGVGDVAFTGDAAGVRLPGLDLVDLPAPPPEFDREAWLATLDRLEALAPAAIYPTHFGRLDRVREQLNGLRALLGEASGLVRGMMVMGAERDDMLREYRAWGMARMRCAGAPDGAVRPYDLANPFEMSVDGIARYWRKQGLGEPGTT